MRTRTLLTPEERRARQIAGGRKGGLTRAKAFTPEFQRMARAHVSHDACVANGRLGGNAYVKKYGIRKLIEQARLYRLENPSDLERIVEGALIAIGARDHEREAYLFPQSHCHHNTGDFVFRQGRRVVYADGAAWHNGKDLPLSFADCADRRMRDEAYDNYLQARGWRILRLSETEIRAHASPHGDDGAMITKLREFLEMNAKRKEAVESILSTI
jgi:very-short-patch-repair endonuclease